LRDHSECYSVQLSTKDFQSSNKGQKYRIKKIGDESEKYLKLKDILGSQGEIMYLHFINDSDEEIYYKNDIKSEKPYVFEGNDFRGYEIFGLNEEAKKAKEDEEAKQAQEAQTGRLKRLKELKEAREAREGLAKPT
jgi:hypothetical protein